jgi:hypothetical protein
MKGDSPRASERVCPMTSRTWRAICSACAAWAFGFLLQRFRQGLAFQFDPRQVLADAIVQILPDPALLHFADLQNFLFQPLPLRHLHGRAGDAGDPAQRIPHRLDRQIVKMFLPARRAGNFLPQAASRQARRAP